jgi:hypothetical protein
MATRRRASKKKAILAWWREGGRARKAPKPKKKLAAPDSKPSQVSRALGKRLALVRSYAVDTDGAALSAREISRIAGLVPTHVWALEVLGRPGVTADTVSRLAKVFGVSLDWLYGGVGTPPTRLEVARAVQRAQARHARKLRRLAA